MNNGNGDSLKKIVLVGECSTVVSLVAEYFIRDGYDVTICDSIAKLRESLGRWFVKVPVLLLPASTRDLPWCRLLGHSDGKVSYRNVRADDEVSFGVAI